MSRPTPVLLFIVSSIGLRATGLVLLLFVVPGNRGLLQDVYGSPKGTGSKVIVLDPGHGGHNLGAVGASGTTEKWVTLALAERIKEQLSEAYSVHLTRNGDYSVEVEKRTAAANHHGADVLISLHAGGGFQHKAGGITVFYCGFDTDQGLSQEHLSENWQAERVWNSLQHTHTNKSKLLANLVRRQLVGIVSPVDRGIYEAPCIVLEGADMPAILVEVGYVSQPAEEKKLSDPEVISVIANAIIQGVKEFFRCINEKGVIAEEDIGTGRGAAR